MSPRSAVSDRLVVHTATTAALAAVASSFTILGWSGLAVDPSGYTRPLILIAIGVALGGVVLRSLGVPRPLTVALQGLGVAETLHVSWAGNLAVGGWFPTAASLREVGAQLGRAVDASQQWAAPVPDKVSAFDPLLIAVGAGVILLVDAYAVTYHRATLAGLPLLAAFTLPVAVIGGMRWEHFVLAAGAFLLLVAAEQLHAVGRWGRPLVAAPRGGASDTVPTTARMLGRNRGALMRVLAPSLLLAAAGALVVPDDTGFLAGAGAGGSSDVRIRNPIADLRRDLVQGPDVNLVMLRTTDPDPSYLRISALDSFDGDTWRPSQRELPSSQRVDGEMPPPVGLDDGVARQRYRYQLTTSGAMDSDWLPLPFPAVAADAPGDWRYDDDTLDVTTTDEDLDTTDLDYSAVGLDVTPTTRQLVEAPAPPTAISSAATELPFDDDEVPPWLGDLVAEVTQGAESDFAQAVALQEWFRDPDNFTYSTDRPDGNGVQDLETFLTPGDEGRVGYCEQFSSAMAVMARVAGIPARVAVGFLRPDAALGSGSWIFSARDLHSWPEIYFSGVGWVRFEPTPADRAPSVPGYTTQQLPALPAEEASPTATASAPSPTREQRPEERIQSETDETIEAQSSRWWWAALLVVVIPLLLLLPRLLRLRHRRRRARAATLGGDRGAEAAWDEVRATTLDLGHRWDDGATLRGQQQHLMRLLHEAPVGSRASGAAAPTPVDEVRAHLGHIVSTLERGRFAAAEVPQSRGQQAWAGAALVTQALWDRAERRVVRRATWWPRSLRVGSAPEPGAEQEATRDQALRMEDNVRV